MYQKSSKVLQLSLIKCIFNCDRQISVLIDWSLQVELKSASGKKSLLASYSWELYRKTYKRYEPVNGWTDWTSGLNTSSITINGSNLKEENWYRVGIKVVLGTKTGYATYDVISGKPPYGGKCWLSPDEGIALDTQFHINCSDWQNDENIYTPQYTLDVNFISKELHYMVQYSTRDDTWLVYYGDIPHFGPFVLGMGDENNDYQAKIIVKIYDVHFIFTELFLDLKVLKPEIAKKPLRQIQDYLLLQIQDLRVSNRIHFSMRYKYLNIINSVLRFINAMKVKSTLENLQYDANKMTKGQFIDFDMKDNTYLSYNEVLERINNRDSTEKIAVYSNITALCIEILINITKLDDEIDIIRTMSSLNMVIGYHPYVKQDVMNTTMNISSQLMSLAINLSHGDISVFMSDIADYAERLINRIMSILNTNQILLSKEGFTWKQVQEEFEKSDSYVDSEIYKESLVASKLSNNERTNLIQQAFLLANEGIQAKRDDASKLNNILKKIHSDLKHIIIAMSPNGRKSKSNTGTSVCSEKISDSKLSSDGMKCGRLNIRSTGDNIKNSKQNEVMEILTTEDNFLTFDEDMISALITSPILVLDSRDKTQSKSFVIEFPDILNKTIFEKPRFSKDDQARMFYHRFDYRSVTDHACLRITLQKGYVLGYEVYLRLKSNPNNDTFDYRTAVVKENLTKHDTYQLCIPSGTFNSNGSMFVGLIPFHIPGYKMVDLLSKYAFNGFSVNCLTWVEKRWTSKHCTLKWEKVISCHCKAVGQIITANTFFIPPNVIDFSTVFLKFDIIENGTVFAVVVGTTCLFILLLLMTCRQDRKNKWMSNIWSLSDNNSKDNYYYLITVFTGLKIGAGTKSNICFILCGENSSTGIRSLSDGIHKGFKTGSVRKFLMNTSDHLSDLIYLKIWSDCSGKGANSSWFLNKVEVMDIETEETYVFRCSAWLAADSSAESYHLILCNKSNDPPIFIWRFKDHIQQSLSDGHLWFSTYVHPCYSTFTRAQRIVCCGTILYLTMITNAMFSPFDDRLKVDNQLQLGPIRLNLRQISVSLQSIGITVPSTFLLVMCFKNSKMTKHTCFLCIQVKDDKKKQSKNESLVFENSNLSRQKFLPYWCVYIGWLWASAVILTSGFFVILYSMQWGKTKSEYWLTAFVLSNVESFTLVDPIKILLVSFLVAMLKRRKIESVNCEDYINILNEVDNSLAQTRKIPLTKPTIFKPMEKKETQEREQEIAMEIWQKNTLINFMVYSLLFASTGSFVFMNQSSSTYLWKESLEGIFANPAHSSPRFSDVRTVKQFYNWTNGTVYPNFFPVKNSFSKEMIFEEKKYISDGVNIKVGPIRLRQLRAPRSDNCVYSSLNISNCYEKYSIINEEKQSYCLLWRKEPIDGCSPSEEVKNVTSTAWKYTPASQVNGIPITGEFNTYSGGGYISNIRVNIYASMQTQNELIRGRWIDRQTRVVLLEFTLYNANFNMFAYIYFLVEFPETGGAIPNYYISIIRPYNHDNAITITFQVVFILCLLILLVKNVYNIMKEQLSFFSNFWNIIDFLVLLFCCVVSSAYIIHFLQFGQTLAEFRKDPKSFVNFYRIVIWNEIISMTLAFLLFFTVIRLSCILGISQRMMQIAEVIKRCVSELIGVSYIFVIYAIAHATVGYVVFGSTWSYRNFTSAVVSIFLIVLGKIGYVELNETSYIFGKLYFCSAVFFMIFILLKMFESVLGDSISYKESTGDKYLGIMGAVYKYLEKKKKKEMKKKKKSVSWKDQANPPSRCTKSLRY